LSSTFRKASSAFRPFTLPARLSAVRLNWRGTFRGRGLPVVLINVTAAAPGRTDAGPRSFSFSNDWTELVPELDQQPGDILISKQRAGAFIGTELDEILRERGVTQVFLTGVATGTGVEATARSAADHGYNVVVVTDAITDMDPEVHRFCIEKIFPRLAETDTTENVLTLATRAEVSSAQDAEAPG
jgi:nicotinamidase-related amidase